MKLNLGCGPVFLPGYLNVDVASLDELAKSARHAGLPEKPMEGVEFMQADLSQPWPWPDNSAEKILADNLLEHLDHFGLTRFLDEARRVLEPGASMEGGVPDFERIYNYYVVGADWSWVPPWETAGPYSTRAANALQNMAHGWGHRQIFTLPMLQERLTLMGFEAQVIHCGMHGLRYTAKKLEACHAQH